MEIKKSPKADLENKRGLLLEIGLIFALVLVIGAFAYTPREYRIDKVDMGFAPVEMELAEVTRQDQKPPEAPKKVDVDVMSDMLQMVTNTTKIENEIDFGEFDQDAEIVVNAPVKREEIVEEEIFVTAETMPSFMGGDLNTFRNWVQGRVKYPSIAQENGIAGRVILEFVVEKDGTLTNIAVLKTPDRSLSDEAIRVLKTSPKWTPAKMRNKPIRLKYTLPVEFRITD